jgi:uncharacterized protein (DUF1330 family)
MPADDAARRAIMVVQMRVADRGWMDAYFSEVPQLLAEHGATQLAASTRPALIEGTATIPDRVAIFAFPSLDAAHAFLDDPHYRQQREARRAGSSSDIFLFEDMAAPHRFA